MVVCVNCGNQQEDGAKFCSECGQAIQSDRRRSAQRNTVFEGQVHRCPYCGDIVDSLEIECATCGCELRSKKATVSVKEFEMKLEAAKSLDSRIALIKTFSIPNAKEDIYDFFILAIANIEAGGNEIYAWSAKAEQTYLKARLLFGASPEFAYIEELYDRVQRQKAKQKTMVFVSRWWMCALGLLITVIGFFLIVWGSFKGAESGDPDSPYHMLAFLALIIAGGGGTLFGLGIKYGVSRSSGNR